MSAARRVAVCSIAALCATVLIGADAPQLPPPSPATDTYYGQSVVDPFRGLEDPQNAAATAWIAAEATRTRAALDAIPGRAAVEAAVKAAQAAPQVDFLALGGDTGFYERTVGRRGLLCARAVAGGPERVIADPAKIGGGGDFGAFEQSPDLRLVAVHFYPANSDASEILILRVADGAPVDAPLADTVTDTIDWLPDSRHVIYDRFGPLPPGAKPDWSKTPMFAFVHAIGAPQSHDPAILGAGISKRVAVPQDGTFVFVGVPPGSPFAIAEVRDTANRGSRFYAAPARTLLGGDIPWQPLFGAGDAFTDMAVRGDEADLATARDAPNYRVVRTRLGRPFSPHTVLPEDAHAVVSGTLDGIPKAGIFALNAARDADYVQVYDRTSSRVVRVPWDDAAARQDVPLPLHGTVLAVATDPRRDGALVDLTSWTDPGDVYAYAPGRDPVATGWRQADFAKQPRVAEELEAVAPDGTRVPVSVVHRPGDALDGTHPVLLQALGAYGFSQTPTYDAVPAAWLALGGVYAVAHVRGGGELGEAWRAGGRGALKANSWNDLIAAAGFLVNKGYATPQRIGLYGPSASYLGGEGAAVTIGRAIEERPDLFKAAVVDSGAFDLIRAERTEVGRLSAAEFGTTASKEGFDALYAMSPYAHVRPGVSYPRLLVRALSERAGSDWQAAKMVAALQAAANSPAAAFLDVDHKPAGRALRTDLYAFLFWQMGIDP